MIEKLIDLGVLDQLLQWKDTLLAAATAPVMPKSVVSNIVEKLVIVAVGAGVALWANDQRQTDALSAMATSNKEIVRKLELLEREGSRPVVELRAKMDSMDARLKVIESYLEARRAGR